MTPKQIYDERKRLRAENELRRQKRIAESHDQENDAREALDRTLVALEKIASVLELWADKQ